MLQNGWISTAPVSPVFSCHPMVGLSFSWLCVYTKKLAFVRVGPKKPRNDLRFNEKELLMSSPIPTFYRKDGSLFKPQKQATQKDSSCYRHVRDKIAR